MNLTKLIGGIKFSKIIGLKKDAINKTDLGVIKVAFMVAALDGEVTDAEYAAFDALAKKCRGYTPEAAATALDEAMRSAGYLMLLSKRVTKAELVKAFIREAKAALPDGFAYCSVQDVRQAIISWIAMGLSDGDYSVREKACIEALRKNFAELKVSRLMEEEERWAAFSPAYRAAFATNHQGQIAQIITKDFVTRVEDLVARYGDSAEATKALKTLVSE